MLHNWNMHCKHGNVNFLKIGFSDRLKNERRISALSIWLESHSISLATHWWLWVTSDAIYQLSHPATYMWCGPCLTTPPLLCCRVDRPIFPFQWANQQYIPNYFHTISIKQLTSKDMSSSSWTWAPLWPWRQTADRQARVRPKPHSPATNQSLRVRHLLVHQMEPVNRRVTVRGLQGWSESLTRPWSQWSWCRWTWMVCHQPTQSETQCS